MSESTVHLPEPKEQGSSISVHLPQSVIGRVEALAKDRRVPRSTMLRCIVAYGLPAFEKSAEAADGQ